MKALLNSIILLVLTVIIASCDGDGNIFKKSPKQLWCVSVSDSKTDAENWIDANIVFGKNTLVSAKKDNRDYLYAIDASNGKIVWEWTEFANEPAPYLGVQRDGFFDGNKLATGSFCIDVNKGETKWTNNSRLYGIMASIRNKYVCTGPSINPLYPDERALYIGDISSSTPQQITSVPFSREFISNSNYRSEARWISYYSKNGEDLLVVNYNEPGILTGFNKGLIPKFGLYNITQNRWEYGNIIIDSTYFNPIPVDYRPNLTSSMAVLNDKVYISLNGEIVCYNIATGANVWRKTFNDAFWETGFKIFDGKIVARGVGNLLLCLDPATGNTLWQIDRGGSGSFLRYHSGVIYQVRQKLEGIDINTGELIYEVPPPKNAKYDFFGSDLQVVPGAGPKGKAVIVVNTYTHAYGYEALR